MNHCIFDGDPVVLNVDVECGEYLPPNQRPDGYGIDVIARAGTEVDFVRHDGEHFVFNWANAEAWHNGIYDVAVLALASEFDHEHSLCEDVFDEHQPNAYEWNTA